MRSARSGAPPISSRSAGAGSSPRSGRAAPTRPRGCASSARPRRPTGARGGARRGGSHRHHRGRPDGPDRRPRRGARSQPGVAAPDAPPAVGWRLVLGGRLPRRPGAVAGRPRLLRARLLDLSARCRLEHVVSPVAARLGELLPPGGPALVHGDLWWGNVLFGRDGRAWLIDPSVHGGHPEEDLAMLALFGAVPDRLLHAYAEVQPLQARVGGAGGAVPAGAAPRARRAVRRRLPGPGGGRGTALRLRVRRTVSTSSRYLALTGSGRNAARNELRASSAIASRGRSNTSATALEIVGDVPAEIGGVVRVDRHEEATPHQRRQVVLAQRGKHVQLHVREGHTVSGTCSAASRATS